MTYDKNVYILGAGISAPAGAPLISNFLDKIQEIYEKPQLLPDTSEHDHFKRVLDYRDKISTIRRKIKCNLENIEELLGLLEADIAWGNEDKTLKYDYIYTILKTLEITTNQYKLKKNIDIGSCGIHGSGQILNSILEKAGPQEKPSTSLYHLFAYLIRSNISQESNASIDTVITFNYDLLLDKAFNDVKAKIDYGIKGEGITDSRNIPETDYKAVLYLKLHGSANLCICTQCKGIHILSPEKSLLADIKQLSCSSCNQRKLQPMIIPPVWNKFMYQQNFERVWQRALKELQEAKRIVIIGYSIPLTDIFFNYLIRLGYKNRIEKKLIVINPNETVEASCKKILDDDYQGDSHFQFEQSYFEHLFQSPNLLPIINRKYNIL